MEASERTSLIECEINYFIGTCILKRTPLMVAAKNGLYSESTFRNTMPTSKETLGGRNSQTRNCKKGYCSTPLMIASKNGNVNVVSFFVEHGANVNLQEKRDGKSPLMHASLNSHIGVVSYLVEHGANVDLQDKGGHTALMLASVKDQWDVVTFLVECGANMDLQNKDGLTPLMII